MSSLPPVLGADGPHTLDALQDTDGKPDYPLHIIIVFTLLGAPFKRATLDQIRKRMEAKFPYFLRHTKWKGSVRHILSLYAAFVKVPRKITDPGRGHYWTFVEGATGYKRPRKRGPGKAVAKTSSTRSRVPPVQQHSTDVGTRARGKARSPRKQRQAPPPPPEPESDFTRSSREPSWASNEEVDSMGRDSYSTSPSSSPAFRHHPLALDSHRATQRDVGNQSNSFARDDIYKSVQYPSEPHSAAASPWSSSSPVYLPPAPSLHPGAPSYRTGAPYTSIQPMLLDAPHASMATGSALPAAPRGFRTGHPDLRRTSGAHHLSFSRSVGPPPASSPIMISDVPMPVLLDELPEPDGDGSSAWSLSPYATPGRPGSQPLPSLRDSPINHGSAWPHTPAAGAIHRVHPHYAVAHAPEISTASYRHAPTQASIPRSRALAIPELLNYDPIDEQRWTGAAEVSW